LGSDAIARDLATKARTVRRVMLIAALDTTVELQLWYGIATVVFIGKSLAVARRTKSRRTDSAASLFGLVRIWKTFVNSAKTLVFK